VLVLSQPSSICSTAVSLNPEQQATDGESGTVPCSLSLSLSLFMKQEAGFPYSPLLFFNIHGESRAEKIPA
jgi:hypothetical protein